MRNSLWIFTLMSLFLLAPALAQRQDNSAYFATDPLAQALQRNNVFVGKTMRTKVDASALRALTDQAQAGRPLKIVVVSQLPAGGARFDSRDRYAKALHDYLGLGQGALIIVTPRGISAITDALPPDQVNSILQRNRDLVYSDPANGIRQVVNDLNVAENGSNAAQNAPVGQPAPGGCLADYWWVLPVGLGVGGVVWLGRKAGAKARAMNAARAPLENLHKQVVEGISYADNYLDLLPESAEAEAARQARQEAAGLLEQARGVAQAAREPADYGRAQALLEQAKAKVDDCRNQIDRATGGTGFAVAVAGTDYKATPASTGGAPNTQAAPVVPNLRPEDIPESERGVCFFCSRPARISDLTPVDIVLDGQRRKVLACPDDVRIIQNGAAPEVRTVEADGRRVPWYATRSYDPYRDYNRTDVVYMPSYPVAAGYGAYNSGIWDGLLLGSLLSQPYIMPYPVFVTPGGYATANPMDATPMNPAYGQSDFGGADYASANSAGNDFGGVDFGGNAGGSDFGNADFGGGDTGGSDFGGSDFGGGDAGGSDFGGSDFGGGGSDFGGGDS